MYTLYKLTCTISGKGYIGITKHSVEKRWKQHVSTAFSQKKKHYKISRALQKYGTEAWDKEVLASGIPESEIEQLEIDTIAKYDSVRLGYNTSTGGKIPRGIETKKGKFHHSTNNTLYNFYSLDGRSFTGSILHFSKRFGFNPLSVTSILNRNQLVGSTWTTSMKLYLNKLKINRKKEAKRLKTEAKKEKSVSIYKLTYTFYHNKFPTFTGTVKDLSSFYSISYQNLKNLVNGKTLNCSGWRITETQIVRNRAGENNPMFGKARPDYVKKAVSERRRQEADTTLRDWYHTSGLVEKQIRSLDLRDKYGLNISHLKKITDNHPKYKQHKGWRLYVETSDT